MSKFHSWATSERKFYERTFDEFIEGLNLDSNLNVLDYGTGTGGFASMLAETHPRLKIKAVDLNANAIALAKENYAYLPNLKFGVANKITEGEYDLIFYNFVLHELEGEGDIETIEEFIKSAYKNLKKDGRIFVLETRKVPKKEFKEVHEKNNNPHKGTFNKEYMEHNRFTSETWIKMFEGVGFETLVAQDIEPNFIKYIGVKK